MIFTIMKTAITSTFLSNEGTQTINASVPTENIINGIHSFVFSQLKQNNNDPNDEDVRMVTNGFILFNQHTNRDMLTSREKLREYLNDNANSIEERKYVADILLYIQKPNFLTDYDLERCRSLASIRGSVFSLTLDV